MRTARRGRAAAVTAGLLGLTLAATACGTGGSSDEGGTAAEGGAAPSLAPGCEDFADYATGSGTVSIYSSIRDIEAERYTNAFVDFERCTGIDVQSEGTG